MAVQSPKTGSLLAKPTEFTAVKEVCLLVFTGSTGYLRVHVRGLVDSLEGDN